jgi:hypothetical protein
MGLFVPNIPAERSKGYRGHHWLEISLVTALSGGERKCVRCGYIQTDKTLDQTPDCDEYVCRQIMES